MQITPIKTEKITPKSTSLTSLCDRYISKLDEGTIIAVSSKIVSLCEGSVVSDEGQTRNQLAELEADAFIPTNLNKYGYMITLKNNKLIASSGIDNGRGEFILWPRDPQSSANSVRELLLQSRGIKNCGVIITDTKSAPTIRGTVGFALAHSGFKALNDYRGKTDVYGGIMRSSVVNMAEALAAAAVVVMGEGGEQQPLAIIQDVPFVQFQDRNPTSEELNELALKMEDDLFAPLLLPAPWEKGEKNNEPPRPPNGGKTV